MSHFSWMVRGTAVSVPMMSEYTKINLADVVDIAPQYGMDSMGEARFARQPLGAERIGLAHYRVHPGQRASFGHRHGEDEEVYLVLGGAGRFKIGDEVIDVGPRDVVYVPPASMRAWEAGDEGLEMIAFGAHTEDGGFEMEQNWWTDETP
jgi:mannose-6-phosphate isomerase-like protein (cupin superfamily)